MRKFGLIGYPLGHSFSRKYFSEKFINENIKDCSYDNYPIRSINLLKDIIAREPDLVGLNVTIPFKSEVIQYLDSISAEASEIGAVNVLRIKREGALFSLHGFNSDVTGIRKSLSLHIAPDVKNALVLGTGGSSRSVCYVLRKLGLYVTVVSRDKKEGAIAYSDLDSKILTDSLLIVNTTPLGMFPEIDTMPDIDYSMLNNKHILFDLVYNPEITSFMKMGMRQGCTLIGGLTMLHAQAEKAWEIWNDEKL